MLPAALNLWEHAPNGWSFVVVILASVLLTVAARGPAYIAAWSKHVLGQREHDRLDRLAQLGTTAASDSAREKPEKPGRKTVTVTH